MKAQISIGYRKAMVWDTEKLDNETLGAWLRATLEMCVTAEDYSAGDDVRIEPRLPEAEPQESDA